MVKIKGIKWSITKKNENEGRGVAHEAIFSMKKSCHEVLKILLEVPDVNINHRDDKGFTALEYALMKRDFKSIMILFSLPQLDLKKHDFNQIQELADIETMIKECQKANRATGLNYSEVVDFLTDLQESLPRKRALQSRKKKGRGN